MARERRDNARKLLADNIDPSENRKARKAARAEWEENSFEVIAREWYAKHSATCTASARRKVQQVATYAVDVEVNDDVEVI